MLLSGYRLAKTAEEFIELGADFDVLKGIVLLDRYSELKQLAVVTGDELIGRFCDSAMKEYFKLTCNLSKDKVELIEKLAAITMNLIKRKLSQEDVLKA